MASVIQVDYNIYQQEFWPGQMPYLKAPHHIILGPAQVPMNGRKPRPGDSVYWDATNDGFAVPAAVANQRAALGIVVYDSAVVQSQLDALPSNANSAHYVEYDDGDIMKVCIFGHVAVIAGGNVEREADVAMQTDDWKYDALTKATTVANIHEVSIVAETGGSNNDIIIARIGYGRVN